MTKFFWPWCSIKPQATSETRIIIYLPWLLKGDRHMVNIFIQHQVCNRVQGEWRLTAFVYQLYFRQRCIDAEFGRFMDWFTLGATSSFTLCFRLVSFDLFCRLHFIKRTSDRCLWRSSWKWVLQYMIRAWRLLDQLGMVPILEAKTLTMLWNCVMRYSPEPLPSSYGYLANNILSIDWSDRFKRI